jgi:hypothetical protein
MIPSCLWHNVPDSVACRLQAGKSVATWRVLSRQADCKLIFKAYNTQAMLGCTVPS